MISSNLNSSDSAGGEEPHSNEGPQEIEDSDCSERDDIDETQTSDQESLVPIFDPHVSRRDLALAFPELARALRGRPDESPDISEALSCFSDSDATSTEDSSSSFDSDSSSYSEFAITAAIEANYQPADSSEDHEAIPVPDPGEYNETVWTFEVVQNTDVSSTTPED